MHSLSKGVNCGYYTMEKPEREVLFRQAESPAEAGDGIVCMVNGQTVPVMTSVAVPGVTVNVPSVFCVNVAAGTVICPASVV